MKWLMFVSYPDAGPWHSDNTHHPQGAIADKLFPPSEITCWMLHCCPWDTLTLMPQEVRNLLLVDYCSKLVRLGLRSLVLWVLQNPPALPVPHCLSGGSAAGNRSPRGSWNLHLSTLRTWPGRAKFDLHLAIFSKNDLHLAFAIFSWKWKWNL